MHREIPVSSRFLSKKWDDQNRAVHYERLKNVHSMIDNTRPSLTAFKSRAKKEQIDEDRYLNIERENQKLLERMTAIIKTQHQQPMTLSRGKSLNREFRKKEEARVMLENQALLRRLQERHSSYSIEQWKSERKETERLLQNICQYPYHLGASASSTGLRHQLSHVQLSALPSAHPSHPDSVRSHPKDQPHVLPPLQSSPQAKETVLKRGLTIGDRYFLVEIQLIKDKVKIQAVDVDSRDRFSLRLKVGEAHEIVGKGDKVYEKLVDRLAFQAGELILIGKKNVGKKQGIGRKEGNKPVPNSKEEAKEGIQPVKETMPKPVKKASLPSPKPARKPRPQAIKPTLLLEQKPTQTSVKHRLSAPVPVEETGSEDRSSTSARKPVESKAETPVETVITTDHFPKQKPEQDEEEKGYDQDFEEDHEEKSSRSRVESAKSVHKIEKEGQEEGRENDSARLIDDDDALGAEESKSGLEGKAKITEIGLSDSQPPEPVLSSEVKNDEKKSDSGEDPDADFSEKDSKEQSANLDEAPPDQIQERTEIAVVDITPRELPEVPDPEVEIIPDSPAKIRPDSALKGKADSEADEPEAHLKEREEEKDSDFSELEEDRHDVDPEPQHQTPPLVSQRAPINSLSENAPNPEIESTVKPQLEDKPLVTSITSVEPLEHVPKPVKPLHENPESGPQPVDIPVTEGKSITPTRLEVDEEEVKPLDDQPIPAGTESLETVQKDGIEPGRNVSGEEIKAVSISESSQEDSSSSSISAEKVVGFQSEAEHKNPSEIDESKPKETGKEERNTPPLVEQSSESEDEEDQSADSQSEDSDLIEAKASNSSPESENPALAEIPEASE